MWGHHGGWGWRPVLAGFLVQVQTRSPLGCMDGQEPRTTLPGQTDSPFSSQSVGTTWCLCGSYAAHPLDQTQDDLSHGHHIQPSSEGPSGPLGAPASQPGPGCGGRSSLGLWPPGGPAGPSPQGSPAGRRERRPIGCLLPEAGRAAAPTSPIRCPAPHAILMTPGG